jgi:hypothetical protein
MMESFPRARQLARTGKELSREARDQNFLPGGLQRFQRRAEEVSLLIRRLFTQAA